MRETCPLCAESGGKTLWQNQTCRIVLVDDSSFPGFCRVIWNDHVSEMSDLSLPDSMRLMAIVFKLETVVREVTGADKINLASLGNLVPHLHWHVIPRWHDDSHFPLPIWANAVRKSSSRPVDLTLLGQLVASELGEFA